MVDFEAEKVNNLSISRKYDINFYMISYIKVDVAETELRNFKFSSILEGSSMLKTPFETTDFMYIYVILHVQYILTHFLYAILEPW